MIVAPFNMGMPGNRAAIQMAARVRRRLAEDIERMAADAGISHAALARAAGVSPGYLAEILAGRAKPSHETYAKLAAPLGADLASRLYPNTGPTIRDRHQARILEHLLDVRHPRWRPHTEVSVARPAHGWIDVVFDDRRGDVVIATEIESDLRRIEQTVRWSKEMADSLPSSPSWPTIAGGGEPTISQLLVVRGTRSNRRIAKEFGGQLAIAFPAHPEDALRALTSGAPWPGAALVWAKVDASGVRLLANRQLAHARGALRTSTTRE